MMRGAAGFGPDPRRAINRDMEMPDARRHIERLRAEPEMGPLSEALTDEAQPRDAGMGGFRHRSLHVELEDGFRAAGTLLGQPPPAGIAHTRRAIAHRSVPDEIDIVRSPSVGQWCWKSSRKARADRNGSLAAFLKPELTPAERTVAQVEGWILGVPGLIPERDWAREGTSRTLH
jgi:hypothetical protein